jgi:stage II sporulation protein M
MGLKKSKIKGQFKESFEFIIESKKYIFYVSFAFLILSILVALGLQSEILNEKIIEELKKIMERFEGKGIIATMFLIFQNNLTVAAISLILGIGLGIVPIFVLISNAYVIGFIAETAVREAGILILFRLVPHGIFELPAIFISLAIGIKLGMFPFQKNPKEYLKTNLIKSIKAFLLVILPLLFIAAIIEGLLIFFI